MTQNAIHSILCKSFVQGFSTLEKARVHFSHKNGQYRVGIFAPDMFRRNFTVDALWKRAYMINLMQSQFGYVIAPNVESIVPGQVLVWRPIQKLFPREVRYTQKVSEFYVRITEEIENRGARIFPDSKTISCYENKINMHRMFNEKNINTPGTIVVNDMVEFDEAAQEIGLPCIVKGPYSHCSYHVHKISDSNDLEKLKSHLGNRDDRSFNGRFLPTLQFPILVQQFIDLRMDIRIVIVGDKIIFSYWRTIQSKEWRSTVTRLGSKIDFKPIPDRWKSHIIDAFLSMDMPWGALDIAWDNDDHSTPPYILEVSPCFDLNPIPSKKMAQDYYSYFTRPSLRNNCYYDYWKGVLHITKHQIDYLVQNLL